MVQHISSKNIAGLSLGGGRKENFFLCLLEFFPDSNRWFLSSVHQFKEEGPDGDEVIKNWIDQYLLKDLIIDFPLGRPACESCHLNCPGIEHCPVTAVVNVRRQMNDLLEEDQKSNNENPKKYEQERVEAGQVDFSKFEFSKETFLPMMSKAFKRRLKKGYLPYWNRPIDFWIWKHFYDPLLNLFKTSYDSFGNVSVMLMFRFEYLKKHFPHDLKFFESNVQLCLLELYRAKIIPKNIILELLSLESVFHARHQILKAIEKHLNVFIYDRDLELLIRYPRAFDSFVLSVAGMMALQKKVHVIPSWAYPEETNFVLPLFV